MRSLGKYDHGCNELSKITTHIRSILRSEHTGSIQFINSVAFRMQWPYGQPKFGLILKYYQPFSFRFASSSSRTNAYFDVRIQPILLIRDMTD